MEAPGSAAASNRGRRLSDPLFTAIRDLSRRMITRLQSAVAANQISRTAMLIPELEITHFEYKQGNVSYQSSATGFRTVDRVDIVALQGLAREMIGTPEYEQLAQSAVEVSLGSETLPQLAFQLLSFLSGEGAEAGDADLATEAALTLCDELRGRPLLWKIRAQIEGLWVATDEVLSIGPSVELRRPRPEDGKGFASWLAPAPFTSPFGAAVLELTTFLAGQGDNYNRVETELNLLRLFRLGAITATGTSVQIRSVRGPRSWAQGGDLRYAVPMLQRYAFTLEDVPAYRDFATALRPVLDLYRVYQGAAAIGGIEAPAPDSDPIGIALQRYKDALLQPGSEAARLTSAITCMEAMLLHATERDELSHRLGQRAAALMSFFGRSAVQVHSEVTRAYGIRSTFIHGGHLEEQEDLHRLLRSVLECSRLALVVLLWLRGTESKDALIARLDRSLLDPKSRERLHVTLRESHIPGVQ